MARAELRYNERAWAIDLISHINCNIEPDGIIQRASGEHTLSTDNQYLFPDILLFGDQSIGSVLQGWELKMPDTAIDDPYLVSNAEKKARSLGLKSFVVWNVTESCLYILDSETDCFLKQDESLFYDANITTRSDVQNRSDLWKEGAIQILHKLNVFFDIGIISGVSPEIMFSDTGLVRQLLLCQSEVKAYIESKIQTNNQIDAKIKLWWKYVKNEYPGEKSPAGPLAYRILFRWFNRFVFANILKAYRRPLQELENLNKQMTVESALTLFSEVSRRTDFWNVFGQEDFDDLVPQPVWNTLVAFSEFIQDFEFGRIDRAVLQSILKSAVLASIKKAAGLYVTPSELARLLVLLSLEDRTGLAIDPFCGTGTIIKAILEVRSDYNVTGRQAVQTTWGSDKFAFPIQVSTLAVSTPENMNEPLRIFTHDALTLTVGENISFVDPSHGENISIPVPCFSAIISNLPFVQFEDFAELNQIVANKINEFYETHSVSQENRLDVRGDLYSYIPFLLYGLLEDGGNLGVVVSNSWLSTGWGEKFRKLLRRFYRINYVVTSANGRWFMDSKVVTNLLICQKKEGIVESSEIKFVATDKNLSDMDVDETATDILAGSFSSDTVTITSIQPDQLTKIDSLNIGWTSCFTKVCWFLDHLDRFELLSSYADIIRGERWGRNVFYYPAPDILPQIEDEYLFPLFKTLHGNTNLCVVPDANRKAFCCPHTTETLKQIGHTGALHWIRLNKKSDDSDDWYIKDNPLLRVAFLLPINPDKILYFARLDEPAIIDQRSTVILPKSQCPDRMLFHALLNSTISMFLIESIGFGRGLGVLDTNKNSVEVGFRVPNFDLISEENSKQIKTAFMPLLGRRILPVQQELLQIDRRVLDAAILRAIEIPEALIDQIYLGLLSMYKIRKSVGR